MTATTEPRDPCFLAPYRGRRPPAPAWFRAALAAAPERTFFDSHGADIELLTWGQRGRPGLLFLHGNGAHAHWWSHIAPFFARGWRCAALSFSGMGRSDRRPGGYGIRELAADALAAVRAAHLDEGPAPPVMICHSFGGAVGLEAAAAQAGACSALVLIDTPLNLDSPNLAKARAEAPKQRNGHRVFGSREEGMASFRLSPAQDCANHFIADHIARHSLVETEGGWTWHFDPRRVRLESPRKTDGGGPHCPVAYLYGEQSVLVTPQTLPLTLQALPGDTPVIAIPDAAHHVLIDQPLALVSALRALLATWPGAARNVKR